jgi:hypothetical protein
MALQFDGINRLIILPQGTVSLSVRYLWSEWVRWHAQADNCKYLMAMQLIGGDDIEATKGTYIPFYVYLLNGWRIRPQEANHTLDVDNGVLIVNGGGDPFVDTLGTYVVRVNYEQPVQAIGINTAPPSAQDIATAVWAYVLNNNDTANVNVVAARLAAANAFAVAASL